MSMPTLLTLSRIALTPLMVIFAIFSDLLWARVVAACIFCIAAITDFLDGYLARRWRQATAFGAFLDPVADKLLVITALVLLVYRYESLLITLASLIIIVREVTISALREWMAELQKQRGPLTSTLSKWKTAMQMIAIPLLLLGHPGQGGGDHITTIGYMMLYLAAILTVWSMVNYLKAAWPALQAGYKPKG